MFRGGEFREYCFVCEVVASETCSRCKRPVCSDHAPATSTRCSACEAEFYDQPGRLTDKDDQAKLLGGFVAGIGVPAAVVVAAAGMIPVAIGIGVGTAVMLGGLMVRAIGGKRHRKRFLAQGKEQPRLTSGDDEGG